LIRKTAAMRKRQAAVLILVRQKKAVQPYICKTFLFINTYHILNASFNGDWILLIIGVLENGYY